FGRVAWLDDLVDPFVTALNATPRIVWLPLLILWFGLGIWSKVLIVFLGAVFPLLVNTYEGVRNADRVLVNVVRSFGGSSWQVARIVVLPGALPYVVAGLRLAIGRAVLGVVVGEFFGVSSRPRLQMPRWSATSRLPNPTTVVSPLRKTAAPVLRGNAGPPCARDSTNRITRLMPYSADAPIISGNPQTFERLKRRPSAGIEPTAHSVPSTNGTSPSRMARGRRRTSAVSAPTQTKA